MRGRDSKCEAYIVDASEHRELRRSDKAGKEPEGGSKKGKEVGIERALGSMCPKQRTVNE